MKSLLKTIAILSLSNLLVSGSSRADGNTPPASEDMLNLNDAAAISAVKSAQKAVISLWQDGNNRGLKIDFSSTSQYPGASLPSPEGGWDLSAFSGVEAAVTNSGSAAVRVMLRVDNEGDWDKQPQPWNAEFIDIGPGDTKTLRVNFGTSWGQPGYVLDPKHVVNILIFAGAPSANGTMIVRSIKAAK